VIGVASYERLDADRADLAVLVDDARQGEVTGTLLQELLTARARWAGIAELLAAVLPANAAMLRDRPTLVVTRYFGRAGRRASPISTVHRRSVSCSSALAR
jgi:hypothetical protein